MDWQFCKVEKLGRIVNVSFDRGIPANPMSDGLMKELTDVARYLEEDMESSVIVLTGRADNFSMGFDLKEGRDPNMGMMEKRRALQRGPRLCRAWEELEQMTTSQLLDARYQRLLSYGEFQD